MGDTKKRLTQANRVYEYMELNGSITSMQAFSDLRVTRLSARIADLKKEGKKIGSTTETNVNEYGETSRYARYFIIKGE